MGWEKDNELEVSEKDLAWEEVARKKHLGCKVCGQPNPERGQTWWNDLCPEHSGTDDR